MGLLVVAGGVGRRVGLSVGATTGERVGILVVVVAVVISVGGAVRVEEGADDGDCVGSADGGEVSSMGTVGCWLVGSLETSDVGLLVGLAVVRSSCRWIGETSKVF